MSIPASQIVQINPRLLTPGGTDLEFNGLLMSKSASIPSSLFVIPFSSPEDVGAYFGTDSEEYAAAVIYFQGYNNSFKKPRALYVASRVSENTPAFIRGGAYKQLPSITLAELQKITNGSLTVRLGSGELSASGIDLSAATSLSNAASIIDAALSPATTPATSGQLVGGDITLSSLASINDGAFSISIDGTTQNVSGLTFDADPTLAEVATALSAKLTGVTVEVHNDGIQIVCESTGSSSVIGYATSPASGTDVSALLGLTSASGASVTDGTDAVTPPDTVVVTYSSLFDAFTLTSTLKGENAGVDYATGSMAEALGLTQNTGAVLSAGMNAMTEAENMEAILDLTTNWVCFTTTWKVDQNEALAYARWASGKGVNYLYVFWDNATANLEPNNSSTIAAALTAANVGATCAVWDSLEYAAMILGTAASIDWNRRQGVITFAFKSQDGLAANVVTGANATALKAQNINFMGDYATRNDNFVFMYPGSMFGSWKWIDTYLNAVWLNNALQVAIMAGLNQTPRVPYNDEGYTLVRAWCMDPIKRASYSGIIDTGITLSESQKAEIYREAGEDISEVLYTDGFYLKVSEPAPAIRQIRDTPECSLWYSYGGSIHRIDLASTAIV